MVFNEVAEAGISLLAKRCFKRERFLKQSSMSLRTVSTGMRSVSASSSGVGSRPISLSIWRHVRTILLIASVM
jgi:hypothetical protein